MDTPDMPIPSSPCAPHAASSSCVLRLEVCVYSAHSAAPHRGRRSARSRSAGGQTAEAIDAAIRRGVDFLVADQNSNGSWGGPTRTKGLNIYAPLPGAHHAFRAGASGLALAGLIDAADPRPEVAAAIEKAAAWTAAELPKLRRADQTTTYNAWGHAYGLRALTRLYQRETDPAKKAEWARLAQQQVDLANRYEDVNGGWGYLDLFDERHHPEALRPAHLLHHRHRAARHGRGPRCHGRETR